MESYGQQINRKREHDVCVDKYGLEILKEIINKKRRFLSEKIEERTIHSYITPKKSKKGDSEKRKEFIKVGVISESGHFKLDNKYNHNASIYNETISKLIKSSKVDEFEWTVNFFFYSIKNIFIKILRIG